LNRNDMLVRLKRRDTPWDILIVGGGATGVGSALDAASRGYDVALVEQCDFGKGTSSRSTKLVHGGVRYLRQGNIPLVTEALRERGILRRNAPHLVHDLPFIVPNYAWWEAPFYGIGMRVYDALAGRYGFGHSANLSSAETVTHIPTIETDGLRGGVIYHDGQFDDARLLMNLATTAYEQGAVMANYLKVTGLLKDGEGFVTGAKALDVETGEELEIRAKVVVNATGPFSDGLRRMDKPDAPALISPSQGIHFVLDRSFLPGDSAIMVPQTEDGRVLFAIPWHNRTLLGTTDTPISEVTLEPRPMKEELDFLFSHAIRYFTKDPTPADVLSVYVGIRPLAKASDAGDTAALSREHTITVSDSGLLTIAGGKWTTYRKMAEDVVEHASVLAGLPPKKSVTENLNIHGFSTNAQRYGELSYFGSDAVDIQALMRNDGLDRQLHPSLPIRAAEVIWATRHEMARTVDDVLARRTRCLLLDARASMEIAPTVASMMAAELRKEDGWAQKQVEDFTEIASGYVLA
jgi:glycerol-3-phosphate dehydrogenase